MIIAAVFLSPAWTVAASVRSGSIPKGSRPLYAVGYELVAQPGVLKTLGLKTEDLKYVLMGMRDAAMGDGAAMPSKDIFMSASKFMAARWAAKAAMRAKADEPFLAEAGRQPDAKILRDGVVVRLMKEGKGRWPHTSDLVVVNYKSALSDGSIVDKSHWNSSNPMTFPAMAPPVGCWRIVGDAQFPIKAGAELQVTCPAMAAYGIRGAGGVPGGAVVQFTIKVARIIQPHEPRSRNKPKSPSERRKQLEKLQSQFWPK